MQVNNGSLGTTSYYRNAALKNGNNLESKQGCSKIYSRITWNPFKLK